MKEIIVLLTACINPNGMSYTVLQDTKTRLNQYLRALDWYLANTKLKILFVENTGYDISPLYSKYITENRLEVISFNGNEFDKTKGKGYGEALIMQYAFKNSLFLKKPGLVIKITGRLIVENISLHLLLMKRTDCIYALRYRNAKTGMGCISYFFAAPTAFYNDYLIPQRCKINDSKGFFLENLLFEQLVKWRKDGGKYREPPIPIIINGQSGSTGDTYPRERFAYIKACVRALFHTTCLYR